MASLFESRAVFDSAFLDPRWHLWLHPILVYSLGAAVLALMAP